MVFTIEEIKHYLKGQKTLNRAIRNLSEHEIVLAIPIEDVHSLNFERTNDNLLKYEEKIGMTKLKEEQKTIRRNSHGNKGKQWLACSPKWLDEDSKMDTKYQIGYWVNYGDDMTYGWFSVEQIRQWLMTPDLFLHELGGTKER